MKDILNKGISILIFTLFFTLFIQIFITSTMKNYMLLFVFGVLLVALILAIKYKLYKLCDKFSADRVFCLVLLLMIILQVLVGYYLNVELGWDMKAVWDSAVSLAKSGNINTTYFSRYPNNIMLLRILAGFYTVIYKLFKVTPVYPAILLNIFAIDISIVFAYKTAKLLWQDKGAFCFALISLFSVPFYLYVPIFYTDTFSLPFYTIAIYLSIKHIIKKPQISITKLILIGLLLMLCYKIKGNLIIIPLALIIHLFLNNTLRTFIKSTIVLTLSFSICLFSYNIILNDNQLLSTQLFDEYKFPPTHWIMMGLRGVGNYNSDDVKYTIEAGNYDSKVEANMVEIKNRLHDMGAIGTIKHVNNKATKYTWNYGSFFAERYLGDGKEQPIRKNFLHEIVLSKGKYHPFLYAYYQGMYLFLFALMCYSMFKSIGKNGYHKANLLHLVLVGMLFFFIIWETHPRYIYNSYFIIILNSISGIHILKTKLGENFINPRRYSVYK